MCILDHPGPEFQFLPVSGQRVLVLGMGGGSDILFAYLLARQLPQGASSRVSYGNTKRNARDLNHIP